MLSSDKADSLLKAELLGDRNPQDPTREKTVLRGFGGKSPTAVARALASSSYSDRTRFNENRTQETPTPNAKTSSIMTIANIASYFMVV